MAYATVNHVLGHTAWRGTYNANTIPTDQTVIQFILESAAQIDSMMLTAGYAAPFDVAIASGAIPTTGVLLLQQWNAIGAALMVERVAQDSDRQKDFEVMCEEAQKMMVNTDLDFPRNAAKAYPRQPLPVQAPAFTRGMTF